MKAQHDDLVQGGGNVLERIIDELDEAMRKAVSGDSLRRSVRTFRQGV